MSINHTKGYTPYHHYNSTGEPIRSPKDKQTISSLLEQLEEERHTSEKLQSRNEFLEAWSDDIYKSVKKTIIIKIGSYLLNIALLVLCIFIFIAYLLK